MSPSAPKVMTAESESKVRSSDTVKSSCTFKSTVEKLAKASVTAAPAPAPSR